MMIEEDVMIARWGFAAVLVFASLLTAAFLCWLHEHGIRLSEPILKFLRRPIGEVLIVLVCVGGLVQHGATKGFFGGPRMMAPREMQTELASAPESVESVAGMFPSYTNAVTNVCATGIMPAETSVFLRAHWPWNLYPAPTGVEVYAAPQLSTNTWVGVGTAVVIGSDNSAVIELPYSILPDGWTSSMFFMLGLNVDTDQDGLSDSFERIISKTDPNLADTDGDGMPDGWEYNNGLNPLSDQTDDEVNADADSDGISNIAEMGYGTDPQKRDSDGDGIDDLGELGSVRQLDDFVWYDMSGGVNILASEANSSIDDKVWTVDLHYPAVIGGKVYDRLTIDSNALVYLIPSNGMAVTQSKYSYSSLPAGSLAQTNIAVAVNWRDMNLNRQNGSQVRVAHVASNNCTVVEFVNLERRSYPSEKMTAQVVVPGGTNGTILVSYLDLSQNLDGRFATIGLMDSTSRTYTNTNKCYSLQWAYDESESIAPSMTLAYRVGTGTNPNEKDTDGDGLYDDEEIFVTKTDPCLFDTDGDGLSDGDEIERQTNPLFVDTDEDGMPDGWEVKYGLDPLSDDALGDLDEDGLPNVCEYNLHTKVGTPDTDGDGLSDGSEAAWIDTHATIPWFNTSGGTVLLSFANTDKALFTVELPTAITLCGEAVTHALVDVNGIVHFGRTSTTSGVDSVDGVGDLGNDRNFQTVVVAPFSADLYARSALQSKITVKVLTNAGTQYAVFDFARIGTYSGSANEISFQVSVPLNCESNVVYVRYGDVVNASSYNISIGAQGSWNFSKLKYWYGQSPNVTNGMVMAYHFGCGSDPLLRDSDDDGLEDYLEFELGTNPHYEDSDLDGLDDEWETTYNLNPLSGEGDDGSDGDPDGDGLSNAREYEYDTNPVSPFTDADLIPDGVEVGYIRTNAPLPWLVFDSYEDLTTLISTNNRRCVNCATPLPLRIQGENVTNLTISANGIVFFNRAGYGNPGNTTSAERFTYDVDEDALVLAPYLQYAYIRSDIPDRQTSIRYGVATHEGAGYLLIEYLNSYYNTSTRPTNSISFQLAVPTNCPDRAYARYKDVLGTYMNGKNASIGMQSFDGRWMQSWCYHEDNRISDDMSLEFVFGTNSDPCSEDSDNDGLDDDEELQYGTNLGDNDSDADGLPDGWEVRYGLNPLSATGENGAQGDFDGDGLLNVDEYAHGTNPALADTDGDGLSDLTELGGVTTNSLPWLQFETQTNLTASFDYATGSVVTWPLPEPIYLHGVCVTEVTVDSSGLVYFNRKGTRRTWSSSSESRMTDSWTINADSYTVAPFWDYLYLTEETPASVISAGTAASGANRYLVIQYDGVCPYDNRTRQGVTNSVSWQLAVPYGDAERMYVRYSNQIGTTDGREASVGYQDFNGVKKASYCYREAGRIFDGASVSFAVGTNTDPLNADTLGDGSGDYSVYQLQVDPSTHDADDDGLPDAEERARGTNLLNADTDGDGMPDGWEVQYDFNPCVAADADGDADSDGVDNLTESLLGSNPRSEDTDGDGLTDAEEIEEGTSLTSVDTDCDGLEDAFELSIDTNPLQPDTDGDGMDDGWEWTYCRRARMPRLLAEGGRSTPDFDPTVNNNTDTDPDNDFGADPDGDGLSNGEECENRTDPTNPDTDGDGVADGNEAGQNSDPSDATDGGRPNSRVAVQFTFGDPSGSHSEKYRLEITPVSGQGERPASFSWLNANYGECETRTARLKAGWKYEVRLTWAACNHASDGSYYPNYDYTLSLGQDIPKNVVLDDPGSIFRSDYYGGEYYGASHFPVLDSVATITVYEVTKVTVCKPDDQSWEELEDSRVVLDDEELRIKVEIAPQVNSLAQCRQMFGDTLIVKTSGTCPSGVSVPIGDDATMNNSADKSEIRITKTRQQLISLGLLPARNEDGVNEMAWLDMASGTGQSLADSEAFAGLGYADRGTASTMDSTRTLDSTPPNSKPSESYFKAAGREIVMVGYGGMTSERWQLMNQADIFYFSGHGNHDGNSIQGGFTPSMAHEYWNRDLNVAIIAGCSVLDINDYNDNYSGKSHTLSPGEEWEQTGPDILLGYAFIAPGDAGGAPTRIVNQWCANRAASGDVSAWMDANAANHAWNACAIVKGQKYVYFKKVFFKKFKKLQEVSKGEW